MRLILVTLLLLCSTGCVYWSAEDATSLDYTKKTFGYIKQYSVQDNVRKAADDGINLVNQLQDVTGVPKKPSPEYNPAVTPIIIEGSKNSHDFSFLDSILTTLGSIPLPPGMGWVSAILLLATTLLAFFKARAARNMLATVVSGVEKVKEVVSGSEGTTITPDMIDGILKDTALNQANTAYQSLKTVVKQIKGT